MPKKRRKYTRCEPLDRYLQIHGISAVQLAERLGLQEPHTRSMVNGHRPITPQKAVLIEQRIGIPRETLRPDIFVRRA